MYCKEKKQNLIMYDKVTGEYYISEKLANEDLEIKDFIPISICWLIENKCNLNCIYCFAENKNKCSNNPNYPFIVNNILKLNPKTIILTGGEPTLNLELKNILKEIGTKAVTILDSNGTTDKIKQLIPSLSNSVVRFSIDSLNNDIIQKVRPSKVKEQTSNQIKTISDNIDMLTENNIPVIIQTVMTKHNIEELDSIYDFLKKHKIKRWYISAVKYCEKCERDYDEIGLNNKEIKKVIQKIDTFKDSDINVSFSVEEDSGARSRLFVDKDGKFFVDTIINGTKYIGENPYSPTLEEIYQELDLNKHYQLYIQKNNIVKINK